jgi:AraC-like DNA-binding protein
MPATRTFVIGLHSLSHRLGNSGVSGQPFDLQDRSQTGSVENIAAAVDEHLVSPLAKHRRLRPLLFHLLSNFGERLSSTQAAKIVSVERKYFSKFFQRETGFKFSWWNREIRIRFATRLLHERGRNIESVAVAVGYIDLTTFTRAFKKCNGMCPVEYRRSCPPQAAPPHDDLLDLLRAGQDEKRREKDDERRPLSTR